MIWVKLTLARFGWLKSSALRITCINRLYKLENCIILKIGRFIWTFYNLFLVGPKWRWGYGKFCGPTWSVIKLEGNFSFIFRRAQGNFIKDWPSAVKIVEFGTPSRRSKHQNHVECFNLKFQIPCFFCLLIWWV